MFLSVWLHLHLINKQKIQSVKVAVYQRKMSRIWAFLVISNEVITWRFHYCYMQWRNIHITTVIKNKGHTYQQWKTGCFCKLRHIHQDALLSLETVVSSSGLCVCTHVIIYMCVYTQVDWDCPNTALVLGFLDPIFFMLDPHIKANKFLKRNSLFQSASFSWWLSRFWSFKWAWSQLALPEEFIRKYNHPIFLPTVVSTHSIY